MKRINQYKKLFEIEGPIDLSELKATYRRLVKQWHPDKFQEDDPMHAEATLRGREITDGYHFLVSIAPETAAETIGRVVTSRKNVIDLLRQKVLLCRHCNISLSSLPLPPVPARPRS